ncbi:MAG TPA: hypothetical protein VIH21_02075 [Dehalococcoidia bacterium]|jgi:hypothetical protein
MGNILNQVDGQGATFAVQCPVCGRQNAPGTLCRHVRWTFDQGDPLDFAHFALETSPYTDARGLHVRDIPRVWWDANSEWIVEQVAWRFDAREGFVFGELADLDLLARDIWKAFAPEPERSSIPRY